MSKFCTSCGAISTGAPFCTSCGTAVAKAAVPSSPAFSEQPSVAPEARLPRSTESIEQVSSRSEATRKKLKALTAVGLFLLVVGSGVGAFFAGRQSLDLEKERQIGFQLGLDEGQRTGENTGYQRGLREGRTIGCRDVFEFDDGVYDFLVPYNPYSIYNRYPGGQYTSKTSC